MIYWPDQSFYFGHLIENEPSSPGLLQHHHHPRPNLPLINPHSKSYLAETIIWNLSAYALKSGFDKVSPCPDMGPRSPVLLLFRLSIPAWDCNITFQLSIWSCTDLARWYFILVYILHLQLDQCHKISIESNGCLARHLRVIRHKAPWTGPHIVVSWLTIISDSFCQC